MRRSKRKVSELQCGFSGEPKEIEAELHLKELKIKELEEKLVRLNDEFKQLKEQTGEMLSQEEIQEVAAELLKIKELEEKLVRLNDEFKQLKEQTGKMLSQEEIQEIAAELHLKHLKIKELEEKLVRLNDEFKQLKEQTGEMLSQEEIQGPWSTQISSPEVIVNHRTHSRSVRILFLYNTTA